MTSALNGAGSSMDDETRKNLLRECILAPDADFEPPTDDMRVSMDDEDFKTWAGETIGLICDKTVEMGGNAADSASEIFGAIADGVKEIEWGTFLDDSKNMASSMWSKFTGLFKSDESNGENK